MVNILSIRNYPLDNATHWCDIVPPSKMVALREEGEQTTARPIWARYVLEWCEKNHKSQASLARKADINESTFNKMLKGTWNAQPDYLAKIETAMGIKLGTLQKLNKRKTIKE